MVVTRKKQIQKGTKKGPTPEGSTRSAWNSTHAQIAGGVGNATILKSQPSARPVDRPNGIGLKAHSGMGNSHVLPPRAQRGLDRPTHPLPTQKSTPRLSVKGIKGIARNRGATMLSSGARTSLSQPLIPSTNSSFLPNHDPGSSSSSPFKFVASTKPEAPARNLDLEISSDALCAQESFRLHLGLGNPMHLQALTGLPASPETESLPCSSRKEDGSVREETNTVPKMDTNAGDNGDDRMESEKGGGAEVAC